VEPNQVHLVALAVFCDPEQIIHAVESRFTGQVVRDVADRHWRQRIHHDMAVVHPIAASDFHVRTRPDANAASDSAAPDSCPEPSGKYHALMMAALRSVE
jgi:hypothetical protein